MEFSDLALAKLLQTAPELGSLILTFQDLSEEAPEGSDMKVGVFVLKSGSEILYAPVLSRGENLYPIDSLFMESTGKFVPLSRKIIEGVVNAGQINKGKAAKIPNTVNRNPSVQEMVSPPRTGKYAYASTSRLLDFMAGMPDPVKGWVFEKIAAEKSVYDNLDKMFSLKALFDVLKPSPTNTGAASRGASMQEPISVATGFDPRLTDTQVQSILSEGFSVIGAPAHRRTAVSTQDFNRDGVTTLVTSLDGDHDYDLAMSVGGAREAFLPKMHPITGGRHFAIFSNSDYAMNQEGFVVVGESLERRKVLDRTFQYNPPVLLKDLFSDDTFVIMTGSGMFLGPFNAGRVEQSNMGVRIAGISGINSAKIRTIQGYRNFKGEAEMMEGTLYVPYNSIVIRLNKDLSMDLERSPWAASRRREIETLQLLGDEINLGFDGVEFAVNGLAIGGMPQIMSRLIVDEGIDPDQARSFVKQAQETKYVKVYLTKRASSTDYSPAEVPQYGAVNQDPADQVGPQGAFMPMVSQAAELGDSQSVEASIISQLLQVPDLYSQIGEYLPDIEEAVDRLGRTLFLSRLHINTLSETQGPDAVFALLAQLKSVYRALGENMVRLKQIIESSRGDQTDMES